MTDRAKDPAHAWRDRMEDMARRADLPQNVTDVLLGRLNPMNESEGYGRGFRFMPDATAAWVAKIASPEVPPNVPAEPLQIRHKAPTGRRRSRNARTPAAPSAPSTSTHSRSA